MRTELNDLHNLVPRNAGKEVAKKKKTANAQRIVSSKTFFRCCAFEQIIIRKQLSVMT